MDLDSWKEIFENQQRQLTEILSDCQNSSDELVLLASKMSPLLQELQEDMNAMTDHLRGQSANNTKASDEI